MKGPIFDTHAHYCSTRFDPDREELLARLPEEGVVGVCECATHSGDAALAVALAHKFPYVWAAVGIHPESLIEEDAATVAVYRGDWAAELRDLAPLFEDERVVAVGECGLDHHWPIPEQAQLDLLEAHYGVKPILYAAPNTYRAYVKSFAEDYPIWISNYYYKPYFDWTFWQYTDSGELEGYDGYQTHIDLNVYAGSMDEFRQQFGLQAF